MIPQCLQGRSIDGVQVAEVNFNHTNIFDSRLDFIGQKYYLLSFMGWAI